MRVRLTSTIIYLCAPAGPGFRCSCVMLCSGRSHFYVWHKACALTHESITVLSALPRCQRSAFATSNFTYVSSSSASCTRSAQSEVFAIIFWLCLTTVSKRSLQKSPSNLAWHQNPLFPAYFQTQTVRFSSRPQISSQQISSSSRVALRKTSSSFSPLTCCTIYSCFFATLTLGTRLSRCVAPSQHAVDSNMQQRSARPSLKNECLHIYEPRVSQSSELYLGVSAVQLYRRKQSCES